MRIGRIRILLPQKWHVRRMRVKKPRVRRIGHGLLGKPRRPRPRFSRVALWGTLIISVLWVAVAVIQSHARPIVLQMASARVNYLASTAIHDAIGKGLGEGVYGYDSLIAFEKDSAGRITALKTDMLAVNRMKSYITGNVLEAIKNIGTSELGIPFGNLIGGELFSGRGPHIPVRIVPVGSVNAEFSNVFSSAGINQTRHQIMMTVNADLSILTLGDSEETRVSVQVSVAETVIVGSVPDSYANLDIPLN